MQINKLQDRQTYTGRQEARQTDVHRQTAQGDGHSQTGNKTNKRTQEDKQTYTGRQTYRHRHAGGRQTNTGK